MGSKRIKAIVIDSSAGEKPPIADSAAFRRRAKNLNQSPYGASPKPSPYHNYGHGGDGEHDQPLGSIPNARFGWATSGRASEKINGRGISGGNPWFTRRGGKSFSRSTAWFRPGIGTQFPNWLQTILRAGKKERGKRTLRFLGPFEINETQSGVWAGGPEIPCGALRNDFSEQRGPGSRFFQNLGGQVGNRNFGGDWGPT